MSYIEDIQKINKLAKEMLTHGMATSLDEAVSKAQATLRNNGAITLNIGDAKQNLAQQKEKKTDDEEIDQISIEKPAMPKIDWQEAMSKNTQYVVGQLKIYQQMIEQMNNEIILLKRELQTLKNSQSHLNIPSNSREQVINIDDTPAPQKTPEQKSHPKQGNFSSEDVSIEKVFYFGNK